MKEAVGYQNAPLRHFYKEAEMEEDSFICVDGDPTDIEISDHENYPPLEEEVPTQGSRGEKSLVYLTKRFVNYLESSSECDLNEIAEKLDIKHKRRLYDITNVLEGVGMIEKGPRNTIKLSRFEDILSTVKLDLQDPDLDLETEIAKQKEDVAELAEEERNLDEMIRIAKMNIKEFFLSQESHSYLYQRPEELTEACGSKKVFSIRFAEGMTLAVPPEKRFPGFNLHRLEVKSVGRPLEGNYVTTVGQNCNENFCDSVFKRYGRMRFSKHVTKDHSDNKEYFNFFPPPEVEEMNDADLNPCAMAIPLSPPPPKHEEEYRFPPLDHPASFLDLYGDHSDDI